MLAWCCPSEAFEIRDPRAVVVYLSCRKRGLGLGRLAISCHGLDTAAKVCVAQCGGRSMVGARQIVIVICVQRLVVARGSGNCCTRTGAEVAGTRASNCASVSGGNFCRHSCRFMVVVQPMNTAARSHSRSLDCGIPDRVCLTFPSTQPSQNSISCSK